MTDMKQVSDGKWAHLEPPPPTTQGEAFAGPNRCLMSMVNQDTDYQPMTWAVYEDGADPATLAPQPKHGLTIGG
jgi:hypothetical protein